MLNRFGASSRPGRLLIAVASGGFCVAAIALYLVSLRAFSAGANASGHRDGDRGQRPSNGAGQRTDGEDALILHPERHIYRAARTIRLTWNVTKAERAPDGVSKAVYLINEQFPGPVIEARSGDEVIVNVHNSAEDSNDDGIAVHWHGLSMRDANEMDGVVGLTQCAIGPSENFTYRFRIDENQSGTFWYHAHSAVQRADGLFGGLIVHKPVFPYRRNPESSTHHYEAEQLLLIGDWYHRPANAVLGWYQDPNHYAYEPAPDSLLINGRGFFNCSMAVKARPVNCSIAEKPAVRLIGRDRVRLRLVNTGTSSGLTVSLTQGTMKLMAVDGGNSVALDTPVVASIGVLYPGERMDFIVDRVSRNRNVETQSAGEAGLRVILDKENMGLKNFALTRIQSFRLLWAEREGEVDAPSTYDSDDDAAAISHFPLAEASGLPLESSPSAIERPVETVVLYTAMQVRAANHNRPAGTVNHTSWAVSNPKGLPLLSLSRDKWADAITQPTSAQTLTVPWIRESGGQRWIELVLNNFDDKGHPFHLHGYSFFVVSTRRAILGQKTGYNPFDPTAARNQTVNTVNPLRKDTIYVPPMGYVVLRFPLDNDGLWLLHCHVLWHQAVGMGIALQIGDISAEAMQRASALCSR